MRKLAASKTLMLIKKLRIIHVYRLILGTITIEKAVKTKYGNCTTSMDYSFSLVVLHPIIVNLFFLDCHGSVRSLRVTADNPLGDRGFY